jgi:hypothetical protein
MPRQTTTEGSSTSWGGPLFRVRRRFPVTISNTAAHNEGKCIYISRRIPAVFPLYVCCYHLQCHGKHMHKEKKRKYILYCKGDLIPCSSHMTRLSFRFTVPYVSLADQGISEMKIFENYGVFLLMISPQFFAITFLFLLSSFNRSRYRLIFGWSFVSLYLFTLFSMYCIHLFI